MWQVNHVPRRALSRRPGRRARHARLRRQRPRRASRRRGWSTGWAHGSPTSAATRAPPTTQRATRRRRRPARTRPPTRWSLLAGAAEGFALLPNLRPAAGRADRAVVHRARSGPGRRRRPVAPRRARRRRSGWPVPPCPTRPTSSSSATRPTRPSVLHPATQILALRRPGRIVVVDEAFADAIPGEPESLAARCRCPMWWCCAASPRRGRWPGCASATRSAHRMCSARMTARAPHWPLGTLQLEAIAACCAPEAVAEAEPARAGWRALRAEMVAGVAQPSGIDVRRRLRALRPVQRPRCRADAKAAGRQGDRRAALRHLRRSGRAVPARRGARRTGRCWSTRSREVMR